jgi:hypothetical protein
LINHQDWSYLMYVFIFISSDSYGVWNILFLNF